MNRNEFVSYIEKDYLNAFEGGLFSGRDALMTSFDYSNLNQLLNDEHKRNGLYELLKQERVQDNWCELIDDRVYFLLQLCSTYKHIKEMTGRDIERVERLYYTTFEEVIATIRVYSGNEIEFRGLYDNHISRIKEFLREFIAEKHFA